MSAFKIFYFLFIVYRFFFGSEFNWIYFYFSLSACSVYFVTISFLPSVQKNTKLLSLEMLLLCYSLFFLLLELLCVVLGSSVYPLCFLILLRYFPSLCLSLLNNRSNFQIFPPVNSFFFGYIQSTEFVTVITFFYFSNLYI